MVKAAATCRALFSIFIEFPISSEQLKSNVPFSVVYYFNLKIIVGKIPKRVSERKFESSCKCA